MSIRFILLSLHEGYKNPRRLRIIIRFAVGADSRQFMQLLGKLFGLVSGPPVNQITPEELQARLGQKNKPVVVDMRSAAEYKAGHIPGAIHVAAQDISQQLHKFPKDKDIVFQCWHGNTSRQAIAILLNKGWSSDHLFSLSGGISGWTSSFGQKGLTK